MRITGKQLKTLRSVVRHTFEPLLSLSFLLAVSVLGWKIWRFSQATSEIGQTAHAATTIAQNGNGDELYTLSGHKGTVSSLAFSPDGRWLATVGGSLRVGAEIRLWRMSDGKLERSWQGDGMQVSACAVAFSPDGAHLATAKYDGVVELWNPRTGTWQGVFNSGNGSSSSSVFGTVPQSDIFMRSSIIGTLGRVMSLSWQPRGRDVVVAGWAYTTVAAFDPSKGTVLRQLRPAAEGYGQVRYSPDGKLLACVRQGVNEDYSVNGDTWHARDSGVVSLFDARNGHLVRQLPGHGYRCVAWAPKQQQLVLVSPKSVTLWTTSGRLLKTISMQNAAVALFTPDGKRLLVRDDKGTVTLFDLSSGAARQSFVLDRRPESSELDPSSDASTLAISADGHYMASAGGSVVRVWRLFS